MKRILALAAFLVLSVPAQAADIYSGSTKDDSSAYGGTVSAPSGFYLKGDLGVARSDRSIRQDIRTSKDLLECVDANGQIDGETIEAAADDHNEYGDDALITGCVEDGASLALAPDGNYYSDLLQIPFSDENDGFVIGGELSYLHAFPGSRFGVELAAGGIFYTDNKTVFGFEDGRGIVAEGPEYSGGFGGEGDPNSKVAHTGQTSFERDFDIDLVLKGHAFMTPRWSLYAGGGLSWAQASLKTAHTTGYSIGGVVDGVFDNSVDDDDWSLGYVLVAGTQFWATDRVTLGVEYGYKRHDFDFEGGKSTDAFHDTYDVDARYSVSDKISVEDETHTIKAKLGIKLN